MALGRHYGRGTPPAKDIAAAKGSGMELSTAVKKAKELLADAGVPADKISAMFKQLKAPKNFELRSERAGDLHNFVDRVRGAPDHTAAMQAVVDQLPSEHEAIRNHLQERGIRDGTCPLCGSDMSPEKAA
jgi:hypothetical protein